MHLPLGRHHGPLNAKKARLGDRKQLPQIAVRCLQQVAALCACVRVVVTLLKNFAGSTMSARAGEGVHQHPVCLRGET